MLPVPLRVAAATANALLGTALGAAFEDDSMIDIYGNCDAAGATFSLSGFLGGKPGVALVPTTSPLGPAAVAQKVNPNTDFIGTVAVPKGATLVMPVSAAATFLLNVR